MTDKEFCKLDTAFYGEEVDHIKQIALITFNGEELKEYVEHCIKLHLLNIPVVVRSASKCYTCDNCGRVRNDNGCIVCGSD